MIILIHSSKTMKPTFCQSDVSSKPEYSDEAKRLAQYLKSLGTVQIQQAMHVSEKLAKNIKQSISDFGKYSGTAIYSFRGDIYSGLQVETLNKKDLDYAQHNLRIISGLYGILRPLDTINSYRLEMGYKLPSEEFKNLYRYWGDKLAKSIVGNGKVINLTSDEYGKAILKYLKNTEIISPKFLTLDKKTKKYQNIAVHSKIARGAFAHWLIKNKSNKNTDIKGFADIGYKYDSSLSSPGIPVYLCQEFGGKGLSVRLK